MRESKGREKMKKKRSKEKHDICCVCGEEHGLDSLQTIPIRPRQKKICKECVDIIHGLI
jgi:hypothetical protein